MAKHCYLLFFIAIWLLPLSANAALFAVDGDSVQSSHGERFRLSCIDAPEYDQPGGAAATRQLAKLLKQGITLQYVSKDQHERSLTIFHFKRRQGSVNLAMIARGHAWVYGGKLDNCGIAKKNLCAAEKNARQKRLGLWRQNRPITPYAWRRKRFFSENIYESACDR